MGEKFRKQANFLEVQALEQYIARVIAGESPDPPPESTQQISDSFLRATEATQALLWMSGLITVPTEAQEESRESFLLAARTARSLRPNQYIMAESTRQTRHDILWAYIRNFILTIGLLFIVSIGGYFTITASNRSFPGEPLYPLKLYVENARLWVERDPLVRLELQKEFDQTRLVEFNTLLEKARLDESYQPAEINLTGVLRQEKPALWQIDDHIILINSDTRVVGQLEDGLVVEVYGILDEALLIIAERIELRQIELSGLINQDSVDRWEIGGVPFSFSPQTRIQGNISPGDRVAVVLVVKENGEYEARQVKLLE